MRVVLIMAMAAEAAPLVRALGLVPAPSPDPRLLLAVHRGTLGPLEIVLSQSGVDPEHRVDRIGTVAAALNAYATLSNAPAALCLNPGTAGGFVRRGARIGDVIVSQGPVRFHDRRIDLPGFDAFGVGSHPSHDLTHLAERLGLRPGSISTSDSLDATDACHARMEAHGADAKEMEAAAIAGVCRLLGVPFVALKSITDLVDGGQPTASEFETNLAFASQRLAERTVALLELMAAEPEAVLGTSARA